ncbi:hypothetical protein C8J57DRAFT_753915 [Mycena rebaudengoi]|nr:hypothetical protein C8J57DRAFT_753915 [Mycena rebaudengoi]
MLRCPELSKLPKAPRISSLRFRRQTPGSAASFAPHGKPPKLSSRLDPQHPALHSSEKGDGAIWFRTPAFSLAAIPMGVLTKPNHNGTPLPTEPFDSWANRAARGASTGSIAPMMLLNDPGSNRISVSLQLASQSTAHRSVHVRVQILRRFKTALSLIAVRAADVKEIKGRLRIVFDEKPTENWILRGWTYRLSANPVLYRMPYPELVQVLRPALRKLWHQGTQVEWKWAAAHRATRKQNGSRSAQPIAQGVDVFRHHGEESVSPSPPSIPRQLPAPHFTEQDTDFDPFAPLPNATGSAAKASFNSRPEPPRPLRMQQNRSSYPYNAEELVQHIPAFDPFSPTLDPDHSNRPSEPHMFSATLENKSPSPFEQDLTKNPNFQVPTKPAPARNRPAPAWWAIGARIQEEVATPQVCCIRPRFLYLLHCSRIKNLLIKTRNVRRPRMCLTIPRHPPRID